MKMVSIAARVLGMLLTASAPWGPMLLAQQIPPVMAGPAVGLGCIVDRTRLGVFPGSLACGAFDGGIGLAGSAGGEVVLPGLLGGRWGLAGGIGIGFASVGYTALPTEPTRIVDRQGRLVELEREYRQEYREMGGYLRVAAEYAPLDRWSIGLGAILRHAFSTSCHQSERIIGPGSYAFADGAREHAMSPGDLLRRSGVAVEPLLSLACGMPLTPSLTLRPQALLSCEVTAPSGTDIWSRFTAGGSLAMLFALPGGSSRPAAPPPPSPPPLAATLAMRGVDANGDADTIVGVEVRELAVHDVEPLLPAVFFERDAMTLPSRYRVLDPEEARGFTPAGLSGTGVYELQHRTLDVLGARMLEHPGAGVMLVGSTSEGEAEELVGGRARFVGDYLRRVWGIDGGRIAVGREGRLERSSELTEDGRADNRRVEIVGDADDLLAPVVTERVEREFDPPALRIDPAVIAPAGVRRWAIVVTQGTDTLARYGGEGAPAGRAITWRVAARAIDPAPLPLVAQLTVEGSSGGAVTARAVASLSVRRRVVRIDGGIQRMGNRERISYSLVGFDFDDDRLAPGDEAMLRKLAGMTRPGAVVTITGQTDRIGDQARNLTLSTARARNAAAVVRSAVPPGVKVEEMGVGMETTRFSNDTPEGRMLSRGVRVVIEQDAEGGPLSDGLPR